MIEVAGSLWSVAEGEQVAMARMLRDAGLRRLHWDMTDGRFAAAGGFNGERAAELAADTGLAAEAHVMAENSAAEVDPWTEFCDLVIVHIESSDWRQAVDRIERRGTQAGVAVSPRTPLHEVPAQLPVLCMSITPGQAGSRFDEGVLQRIAALRDGSDRRIGVDGGVKRSHADAIARAGADWVVVGSDLVLDGLPRWQDLLGAG